MIRCLFCNGNIGSEGRCIHCGRFQSVEHEEYVRKEQAKEHTGQHTYGANKEYQRSKAGRKTKWE